jgi:hypothetical protein
VKPSIPRIGVAGLWLAAVAACTQLDPDVGPLLAGRCDDADSNPQARVSFARDIQPVISPRMTGCDCHLPNASGPSTGTQVSGLDLSSLSSLRTGGRDSGSQIVVPLQPCASILYQKIENAPPFGSRMPLGGPPFLSVEEIQLIHDWIAEGANDD